VTQHTVFKTRAAAVHWGGHEPEIDPGVFHQQPLQPIVTFLHRVGGPFLDADEFGQCAIFHGPRNLASYDALDQLVGTQQKLTA